MKKFFNLDVPFLQSKYRTYKAIGVVKINNNESGLVSIAHNNSPCISNFATLTPPHPGHGIPVISLKGHRSGKSNIRKIMRLSQKSSLFFYAANFSD